MPVVTPGMFVGCGCFRPNCHRCGRWVGAGGYYSVSYDPYTGGHEEDAALCRRCYRAAAGDPAVQVKGDGDADR